MRILVVVHAFPPHSTGGAETYAEAHARALSAAGHDVVVIAREADGSRRDAESRRERREGLRIVWINNTFQTIRAFRDTYANSAIDMVVAGVVDEFRPEVAHIHHLTCLSTGIVGLMSLRRIPIVFTLHDYWLLCDRGQLLDKSYRVCDGPEPDGCAGCLGVAGQLGSGGFAIARAVRAVEASLPSRPARVLRRVAAGAASVLAPSQTAEVAPAVPAEARRRFDHMRDVMAFVTRFLSPSESLRQRFIRAGIASERIDVWPCGHDIVTRPEKPASPAGPLRAGFLGSVMISKAPHLVAEAIAGMEPGMATFEVFGAYMPYHGDDGYRETVDAMAAQRGVTLRGPIAHDAVPDALASVDVLVLPSIWPENSPLVIREAFLSGLPVIASRIGGIPEAITEGVNGLLCQPGSVSDLRSALQRLVDEPGLLTALRAGVAATAVRPMDDDIKASIQLYEALVASNEPTAPGRDRRETRGRLAAVVLHFGNADETRLAVLSLLASDRPIDDLMVIDNDAARRCAGALRDLAGRIHYLASTDNVGYPAGMNIGIRRALDMDADRILLVNNDVIVPPDVVGALEDAMAAVRDLGAAAPVILSRRDPGRVASAGIAYVARTGRMRHLAFGAAATSIDRHARPTPVDGVSGCVMLMGRTAIRATGFLDEDYFFGFEDLDWCLRARAHGFASTIVPSVFVHHEGGASIGGKSSRHLYFAARNHLRLAAKGGANPLRTTTVAALNVAHLIRTGVTPSRLKGVAAGVWDHLRGRYGRA